MGGVQGFGRLAGLSERVWFSRSWRNVDGKCLVVLIPGGLVVWSEGLDLWGPTGSSESGGGRGEGGRMNSSSTAEGAGSALFPGKPKESPSPDNTTSGPGTEPHGQSGILVSCESGPSPSPGPGPGPGTSPGPGPGPSSGIAGEVALGGLGDTSARFGQEWLLVQTLHWCPPRLCTKAT